jgi:hypothetical protein
MARNAADAVRSARPQGENISASAALRTAKLTMANCPLPRGFPVAQYGLISINSVDAEKFP